METGIEEIRRQSRSYPRVENLMRDVNRESLMTMHLKQPARKAKGVDGVSKAEYGENLEENIGNLLERMKRFSYRPLPVRRTYIPTGHTIVRGQARAGSHGGYSQCCIRREVSRLFIWVQGRKERA